MDYFDKLLEFENHSRILTYKFNYNQILMWPFVRPFVFFEVQRRFLKTEDILVRPQNCKARDFLHYIYLTLLFNPHKKQQADILFFSSGSQNTHKIKGKYVNKLTDYLALLKNENSIIIEDSVMRNYKRPRYFTRVLYHDYITIKAAIMSKFLKSKETDVSSINDFLSYIWEKFPFGLSKVIYDTARSILGNLSKTLRILHMDYVRLFSMMKPKMVFVEDASYGYRSYVLKWAKDQGIITGELQHGLLFSQHPAYNYADGIIHSTEYAQYLPDYILTYGEHWKTQIRTSSIPVTIGNPYLYSRMDELKKIEKSSKNEDKSILFLSDGVIPNTYRSLIKDLARLIHRQEYRIVFRPHPAEVPLVGKRYGEILELGNVCLDSYADVAQSIYNSDFVVGSSSTTLFEAMVFDKPIFIYQNPLSELYTGAVAGTRFTDAMSLYENIRENKTAAGQDLNNIWNRNWKDNYLRFISERINVDTR